jgi:RecA/RadA recombinase
MAKAKIKKEEESGIFNDLDAIIQAQFDNVIDLSKVDGKVKTWYSTGIYALNYAMSKNLNYGVPAGRITSFSGLSGTGKSLIAATIMRDPQLDMIIILETEGGGHAKELIEFAGVDSKKVRILKSHTFGNYKINKKNNKIEEVPDSKFPVKKETDGYVFIEGATRQVKKIVNSLQFNKKLEDAKILVLLDSLGNLQSVREYGGTSDMGARSQDVGKFFRTFDTAFEKSGIAFVFTNKLYTNLGNIYDPYKETGGVNAEYNPSVSVRLSELAANDEIADKDMTAEKERRKTSLGSSIKSIRGSITKSRFGTERRNAWFLFDFAVGPVQHSGLFTLLKDFGIIEKSGSRYSIEGWNNSESFYKKDFINLLLKDEKKNIDFFQSLLEKREIEMKEEKKQIQANDIEELINEEDEYEVSEMMSAMEKDVEN